MYTLADMSRNQISNKLERPWKRYLRNIRKRRQTRRVISEKVTSLQIKRRVYSS